MSWNEPGGGDRDPWSGSGRNNQGPPDLDELLKKLQDRINRLFGRRPRTGGGGGSGSSFGIGLVVVVLLVVWLASGFFVVDEGKRGVVLRFGKYVSTEMPGPHWQPPYPITDVRIVDVSARRTIRIGYDSPTRVNPKEALMLTRDENIVSVQLAVQWQVSEPDKYLFTLIQPEQTLKQLTESALREVVGKNDMDFVLTEGRAEVVNATMALVQQTLDERYDAGIRVVEMAIQDVQPPEPVQGAFSEAIRAREDEQRFINEALGYRNQIIPQAKGEAARIIEEAQGYRAQAVANAQGSVARFLAVLEEYSQAPEVTRERLYIEAMQSVLSRTSKILVGGDSAPLMYLPLDRLPTSGRSGEQGAVGADANEANAAGNETPAQLPLSRERLRSREVR